MAEAKVYTIAGQESGQMQLSPDVFEGKVNKSILFEYATTFLANKRLGTHKTKTRAEVSGGGLKPWRQKGTGRARAGSNTSPVWVRGGKAHGPIKRDYSLGMPKQKKDIALVSALSEKAKNNNVIILESFSSISPKTSGFNLILKALGLKGKSLFVVDKFEKNLFLASRNIKDVEIMKYNLINAFAVMHCKNLVITKEALSVLEKKLKKESK